MAYWRSWAHCRALPGYQSEEAGLLVRLIPLEFPESPLPLSELQKSVLVWSRRRCQLDAEL